MHLFFSGMIIGFLIKYIGGKNPVSITQPNCTISSATKKLYISVVNGSKYSYSLTGPVQKADNDQGTELEQLVHMHYMLLLLLVNLQAVFYSTAPLNLNWNWLTFPRA